MGCYDLPGLLEFDQALEKMLAEIEPLEETQTLALTECLGKTLAENICSPINVPPQDNSAMDGYAVRASDLSKFTSLNMIGKAFAGSPYAGSVTEGSCVRIMTGAWIPEGADCIVIQEDTEANEHQIKIHGQAKQGDHIRLAGSDIHQGQSVFTKGHVLGAADLPVLATLGIAELTITRPVRVAILSTGDELVEPGGTLGEGQIFESNRVGLKAMLQRLGAEVIDLGIIADDSDAIADAFQQGDQQADIVISSGGASVGEADFTRQVLNQIGEVGFWKLAIKPGKPFSFGRLQQSYFFGLPGNPVSSMVTFHQLVVPAIRKLFGQPFQALPLEPAVAAKPFKKSPGRMDFQRAILSLDDNGQLVAEPTGDQSSHILSSMVLANGYAVLEKDRGSVAEGETIDVLRFDTILAG